METDTNNVRADNGAVYLCPDAASAPTFDDIVVFEQKAPKRDYVPGGFFAAGLFWTHEYLTPKQRSRLRTIAAYFTPHVVETVLLPFIEKTSPISLRVLDWVVVTYAKNHPLIYKVHVAGTDYPSVIDLHQKYLVWIAEFGRELFDPFRRHQRIFFMRNGAPVSTTPAQVNFFFFVSVYGVIDKVREKLAIIVREMTNELALKRKRQRQATQPPTRKRKASTDDGPDSDPYMDPRRQKRRRRFAPPAAFSFSLFPNTVMDSFNGSLQNPTPTRVIAASRPIPITPSGSPVLKDAPVRADGDRADGDHGHTD